MRSFLGQGATEYLVLLAVVLVIALVGIALLGFFPGTASDAQMAESRIYWQSATPISIIDASNAYTHTSNPNLTIVHMKIKNTGNYPIRLSKIIGVGTPTEQYMYSPTWTYRNMTDIYLAPDETACFGANVYRCPEHYVVFSSSGATYWYIGANTRCDTSGQGTLLVRNLGFEYIQYVEGQAITKRQVGKDFIAKCAGMCTGSC